MARNAEVPAPRATFVFASLFACVACGDGGSAHFTPVAGSAGGASGGSKASSGATAGRSGVPASCRSDKECTPFGLLCDQLANRCVTCVGCAGGAPGQGGRSGAGGFEATGGFVGSGGTFNDGGFPSTGGVNATGGDSSGGGASTGGFPATGGFVSTGGFPSTGGYYSTGGFWSSGGYYSTGGFWSSGGYYSTGGFRSSGGFFSTGGRGGAWAPCASNSDCPLLSTCTASTETALGFGGMGTCVQDCGSQASCTDPPLPGASPTVCIVPSCMIPCGTGSSCPAGFTCYPTFSVCFSNQ